MCTHNGIRLTSCVHFYVKTCQWRWPNCPFPSPKEQNLSNCSHPHSKLRLQGLRLSPLSVCIVFHDDCQGVPRGSRYWRLHPGKASKNRAKYQAQRRDRWSLDGCSLFLQFSVVWEWPSTAPPRDGLFPLSNIAPKLLQCMWCLWKWRCVRGGSDQFCWWIIFWGLLACHSAKPLTRRNSSLCWQNPRSICWACARSCLFIRRKWWFVKEWARRHRRACRSRSWLFCTPQEK